MSVEKLLSEARRPRFILIVSVVLAGCILILLALVIWLIIRTRKLRRELRRIRDNLNNGPTYTDPGPAPKDAKPRPKNEYTSNPQPKSPEPKRQSFQRQDSHESVTYVPSRNPSLRSNNQSHAQASTVLGATDNQHSIEVTVHEPNSGVQLEMEEIYQNQETIQLNVYNGETSTDPPEVRELHSGHSHDELAFENQGFGVENITEPVYQNRGELAAVNNPQLELIIDLVQ